MKSHEIGRLTWQNSGQSIVIITYTPIIEHQQELSPRKSFTPVNGHGSKYFQQIHYNVGV